MAFVYIETLLRSQPCKDLGEECSRQREQPAQRPSGRNKVNEVKEAKGGWLEWGTEGESRERGEW